MAESKYTLPTTKEPSFWNIDTAVGAGIGGFLGPIGAIIGAIIGGYSGKSRMEDESANGVIAEKASFWNKGILAGKVIGELAALPFYATAFFLGAPVVAIGIALTGVIGGAIYGGISRKEFLNERYETAKALHENHAFQPAQSHGKARGHEPTVSIEEMREMESKMKSSQQGNFAESVLAKREAMQAQPASHQGV